MSVMQQRASFKTQYSQPETQALDASLTSVALSRLQWSSVPLFLAIRPQPPVVPCLLRIHQSLTLCDKTGIPRETFLAFVDAFYPAPPIKGYARRAAEGAIEDGVAVELALKDVRLAGHRT